VKYSASPIINGKFWIVESGSQKIGTIKSNDSGEFEFFNRIQGTSEILDQAAFEKTFTVVNTNRAPAVFANVLGYPANSESVFNVGTDDNIPVYTKSEASSMYYAAGHYAIFFPGIKWSSAFCPRVRTLKTYPFIGPYKTESDVNLAIKRKRNDTQDSNTGGIGNANSVVTGS